jgi:PTH1 family peptidyl-tRNA hydrolase
MKLVIGLGNPGASYEGTRHNVGAQVIKQCAAQSGVALRKERLIRAMSAKVMVGREAVVFAVPLVFMNLSGEAVKPLIARYADDLSNVLVVYDDLDLEVGRLRLRPGGSAGGHNGVKSIINVLHSQEFTRLRIGIGRPPHPDADIPAYVLSGFRRSEKEMLDPVFDRACEAIAAWAQDGIQKSMNVFNREVKDE